MYLNERAGKDTKKKEGFIHQIPIKYFRGAAFRREKRMLILSIHPFSTFKDLLPNALIFFSLFCNLARLLKDPRHLKLEHNVTF